MKIKTNNKAIGHKYHRLGSVNENHQVKKDKIVNESWSKCLSQCLNQQDKQEEIIIRKSDNNKIIQNKQCKKINKSIKLSLSLQIMAINKKTQKRNTIHFLNKIEKNPNSNKLNKKTIIKSLKNNYSQKKNQIIIYENFPSSISNKLSSNNNLVIPHEPLSNLRLFSNKNSMGIPLNYEKSFITYNIPNNITSTTIKHSHLQSETNNKDDLQDHLPTNCNAQSWHSKISMGVFKENKNSHICEEKKSQTQSEKKELMHQNQNNQKHQKDNYNQISLPKELQQVQIILQDDRPTAHFLPLSAQDIKQEQKKKQQKGQNDQQKQEQDEHQILSHRQAVTLILDQQRQQRKQSTETKKNSAHFHQCLNSYAPTVISKFNDTQSHRSNNIMEQSIIVFQASKNHVNQFKNDEPKHCNRNSHQYVPKVHKQTEEYKRNSINAQMYINSDQKIVSIEDNPSDSEGSVIVQRIPINSIAIMANNN